MSKFAFQHPWVTALVVGVTAIFVVGLLIRWIWNTTISDIFRVRLITLWEAVKLLLLAAILFGTGVVPFHCSRTEKHGDASITFGFGGSNK